MTTTAPKSSPWGTVQYSKTLAEGIVFVSTAGHGGVWLSRSRQAGMPLALRGESNWYEEDCDWCRVALAYPEAFPEEKNRTAARDTLRNWKPTAYELFFGVILQPGESYKKDEAAFIASTADKIVAVSASGDWHERCPKGFVLVSACRGGRSVNGQYASATAEYLVPADEYAARDHFGFVVDPARHALAAG